MFLQKFPVLPALIGLVASPLLAGTTEFRAQPAARPLDLERRFEQWHLELSLASGAFSSPIGPDIFPRSKTPFDYTETEIRCGVMLNSPYEAGFFRGNFEFLVGLGGGGVFAGPGSALGNGEMYIRYNFIPKSSRFIPYTQLGAGLVVSDAAPAHDQRIIGRALEFSLQLGVGCRILLNEKWSLDLEGVYEHISNANTADRNVGVNALGGLLALTESL